MAAFFFHRITLFHPWGRRGTKLDIGVVRIPGSLRGILLLLQIPRFMP